jgi:hypothetical protein
LREKMRNKSVEEWTYPMTEKSSPKDLVCWQEKGGDRRGVAWDATSWRERDKDLGVKAYSR